MEASGTWERSASDGWRPTSLVDYSAAGVPLGEVAQTVAALAGVSVSVGNAVSGSPVSLVVHGVPAWRVFELLGDQVSRGVVFEGLPGGGVVRFVEGDDVPRVRGVLLPGGFNARDVAQFLKSAIEGADTAVVGDRVWYSVPASSSSVVDQVASMVSYGADGWMVQVRAVELSKSFSRRLGLAWTVGGQLSVGFGIDDAGLLTAAASPITGVGAAALVRVVASAEESGHDAVTVSEGLIYVREGESASMTRGDRVPIPERRVSDVGSVATTGYTFIDTGFTFKVSAYRAPGGVRLDVLPELSSVTGFVQEVPIVAQSRIESTVVLRSGEWAVLSGLESETDSRSDAGVPGLKARFLRDRSSESSRSSVLVFIRATRVGSGGRVDE